MKDKNVDDSWEAVKDKYNNLGARERDEFHDQLSEAARLLGVKEDTVGRLRRMFVDPTPRSTVADKARALSKLDADLEAAIKEHSVNPQRVAYLKRIHEVECKKIIES